jgi:hypothetical protein
MTKFKIGDKVRRINSFNDGIKSGDIGIIIARKNSGLTEMFSLNIGNDNNWHNEFNLELVKESKHKFRVGDKVKKVCGGEFLGLRVGDVAIVTEIINEMYFRVNKGDQYNSHYCSSWELAEEVESESECIPCENKTYGNVLEVNSSNVTNIIGLMMDKLKGNSNYQLYLDECEEVERINNNNKKSIMSKVSTFVKNLALSADEKLLRKFDLHDDCGVTTYEGQQAILERLFNSPESQAYLIEIAKGLELEANKNK